MSRTLVSAQSSKNEIYDMHFFFHKCRCGIKELGANSNPDYVATLRSHCHRGKVKRKSFPISFSLANMACQALITCLESYLLSLKSCYASLSGGDPTPECIRDHLAALISDCVSDMLQLEDHTRKPLRVLGIGSGDGCKDICFLEVLSNGGPKIRDKYQLFQRTIEPNEESLETFQDKSKYLPERLTSGADVKFEWFPMTFQEYVKKEKKDDIKFDVVHFFHSAYYVDFETALVYCYEKELGSKGIIACAISHEESAFVRYSKEFSQQGLILNPGPYYSSKDITDLAKKNSWKYLECPGHYIACDITSIFDHSSVEGNQLLNFLTHWVDFRATASQENRQKVLDYWKNVCEEDKDFEKRTVWMKVCMIVIVKGM